VGEYYHWSHSLHFGAGKIRAEVDRMMGETRTDMNTNFQEPNPFLCRLNELQTARERWAYSDWLLNFLRTEGSEPPKIPTDEELLKWMQH